MKHRINIALVCILAISFQTFLYSGSIRDFTLPDINNQQVKLSSLTGDNIVVLDFWASWCVPCTRLMPELEKIHKDFENVTVVTVSIDNPRALNRAKSMIRSQGYSFISLFDTNQDVMKQYQVTTVPHTFILDRDGTIVYEHTGYTRGDEKGLIEKIEILISQNEDK